MKALTSKNKKIIIIGLAAALLIAAGIVTAVVLQRKEYRSISVEAVQGSVIVVNDKNNDQAYKGQRLYGGDDVTVFERSDLTMCMNNEKYLYADENTHFRLEDNSTGNTSKIRIVLDKGSELNELTQKLDVNDSYEVDTPNSTMSVRGTKFRVTVYTDSDGRIYTLLEVEEGVVLVRLKTTDGMYNGVEKEFTAGQSALIGADAEISEFVKSGDGETVLILDHNALPKDPVERLRALLEKGGSADPERSENSSGSDESSAEVHTHTPGSFTVTVEPGCETAGEKTAECTVCGEILTEEIAPSGHDYSGWTTVKAADCQQEGSESRTCSVCGKTETRAVSKADHSFGSWQTVKQALCGSEGSEERICSVCGEKESRIIPGAAAHN